MTIEQLKQFVSDRIYTNNNFEVSALDVQEAINQVIDELFARENPDTPTLQQVLDEGNSANLDTLLEVVLTKVGDTLKIQPDSISFEKIDGGITNTASYTSNDSLISSSDNSSFLKRIFISPDSFQQSDTGVDETYSRFLIKDAETFNYSKISSTETIEKFIALDQIKFLSINQTNGEGYLLNLSKEATVYEISSGDDISSKISIHKADTVNTTNGTRGLVLTTKISADQTNDTEAAICIDGDLQIIDIEEEVVTDYSQDQDILIKDSNGVVKTIKNQNSPFIINEVLLDSSVDINYSAELFDFILVEGINPFEISLRQAAGATVPNLSEKYGFRERNFPVFIHNASTNNITVTALEGLVDTLLPNESAEYRWFSSTPSGRWVVMSSNRV